MQSIWDIFMMMIIIRIAKIVAYAMIVLCTEDA